MKLSTRLEKIEAAVNDCSVPLSKRIVVLHAGESIANIEAEYMKRYGTTQGVTFFQLNLPEPDLPPADSFSETM